MLFKCTPAIMEAFSSQPNRLSDALEEGHIVLFPTSPIDLPDAEELRFLRDESATYLKRKNISYYHQARHLVGAKGGGEIARRLRRILGEHGKHVAEFLRGSMPQFARGAVLGTTSVRPLQERGRGLALRASNELVHVDGGGTYGATRGNRILRFFVNINPTESRVWISKGSFAQLHRKYGHGAGVAELAAVLVPRAGDRARGAVLAGLGAMGLPMASMLDNSPYDRAMRRFHNYLKENADFQASLEGHEQFEFAPFSAWMCLTDAVSHACIEGQHALVSTLVIPLENCRLKDQAPYYVLQGAPPTQRNSVRTE